MTTYKYLPDPGSWPVTPVVTPRDTINESSVGAFEAQDTRGAENSPLPIIYGTVRLGPKIANALYVGSSLVILAVWGHGEVDSFVDLQLDDLALAGDVTFTHYLGAPTQIVDPTLVAAFAAQTPPVVYADTLPGICYSVVTVPAGKGQPRLNATIKGLKVWTGAVFEYSDNPAYCIGNFITNPVYGMGRAVDWASVASVAADNTILAGGTEKMRTLNLSMETVQPVQSWLDTLRTYASCWIIPTASGLKLVSDKAGDSVAAFNHDEKSILSLEALRKRGVQSMPTVMTVTYRDTTAVPHRDGTVTVYAAGVLEGSTQRRESSVSLPGINRYSQAFREATERLNKLLLNDLSLTLTVFDEALALDVGDIITVTHPVGLSNKLVRVMAITGEYGRYVLNLVEYDPIVYNSTIATAPSYSDTDLPNPAAPPTVTGVTMVEEVFQQQNGTWTSRWRINWASAGYVYLDYYRAELWSNDELIHTSRASTTEWPTPAIQEGRVYTAKIAAVSTVGSVGTWGTQSGTALGKLLIPSNVPSITAFEAGGTVYASWLPSVDIDIWRYEIRYSPVGGTWETALLLDRVDGLRLTTVQIPVGTWTLHVKCLDSVQQYSATAATVGVVVTSDSNSFLVDTKQQTAPTLTYMSEYSLARADSNRYFVTEGGGAVDTKFTAAMSTYTNILATYHSDLTSSWLGESEDFGILLSGNWSGEATVADVSGSHISYLGHSTDGSTWTYPAGLAQKVNARFARLKHEALTTSTLLVTVPNQNIRIDATPREEVGTGTSSASGPVTVVLTNDYTALKKLTVTPQGTTARSSTFDNVIIGSNVKNPNFETNVDSWTICNGANTFSRDTVTKHDGVSSMKFEPGTGTTGVGCMAVHVTPGTTISFSAWVYCSSAIASGFYVSYYFKDVQPTDGYVKVATYTTITHPVLNGPLAAGWQFVSGSVVVPAGVYWLSVLFQKTGPMESAQVNVDTVTITNFDQTFDVYIFNDAGVKIASAFQYQFQGV